ncbi:unnamed protein product [Laminaria digitata]
MAALEANMVRACHAYHAYSAYRRLVCVGEPPVQLKPSASASVDFIWFGLVWCGVVWFGLVWFFLPSQPSSIVYAGWVDKWQMTRTRGGRRMRRRRKDQTRLRCWSLPARRCLVCVLGIIRVV